MKLLTRELIQQFAALGRQEDAADPIVLAKFFNPGGPHTWYATEYDPQMRAFFGYVQLGLGEDCDEWGAFSLAELEDLRFGLRIRMPSGRIVPFFVTIERDLHFAPTPISELVPAALGSAPR